MSFLKRLSSLFASSRDKEISLAIEIFSKGEAALSVRVSALEKRLDQLEDHLVSSRTSDAGAREQIHKQLADLRAIVTQIGEKAKQGPAVAKSAADIRRFVGGDDAD